LTVNPIQPDDAENECTPDSSDIDLIEADGPEDRTVRPMDPRLLRKPPRPPREQPPAPEGGPPERGPENK
jgi:hypothetical protein